MRLFIIICLLSVSTNSFQAQDLQLTYDHTALVVENLKISGDFYKNVLMLEEIEIPYQNPILRWFSMGGSYQLHLIQMDSAKDYRPDKAVHFALKLPSLDNLIAHLNKLKIPYSDWNGSPSKIALRPDGLRQIYIQDPDGHWIEINEQ